MTPMSDCLDDISSDGWARRRCSYTYPPVGLRADTGQLVHVDFPTTAELDRHHGRLLRCGDQSAVKRGYVSAVYWGRFASAAGRRNPQRAHAIATNANAAPQDVVACKIETAIEAISQGNPSAAMAVLVNLPELGFAFATKVCAFAVPNLCGVADSVIAQRYPCFGFVTRDTYITATQRNFLRYQSYCDFLVTKAKALNSLACTWFDKDGAPQNWRAVDVERALFASAC